MGLSQFFAAIGSLLTKKLYPNSALIVVMFVLLWVVVIPLGKVGEDHAAMHDIDQQMLDQIRLSNHMLWAECVNSAALLPDISLRQEAATRCIPPPEKRPTTEHHSYFYEMPSFTDTIALIPRAGAMSGSSSSYSSSSSMAPVNARRAEQVAEEQNEKRLQALGLTEYLTSSSLPHE